MMIHKTMRETDKTKRSHPSLRHLHSILFLPETTCDNKSTMIHPQGNQCVYVWTKCAGMSRNVQGFPASHVDVHCVCNFVRSDVFSLSSSS